MIRGILAGLFWGAVLGCAGLVVVSATSPLPVRPGVAVPRTAVPEAGPVTHPAPVAEPAPVVVPEAESGPEVAAPAAPGADVPAGSSQPDAAPEAPDPSPAALPQTPAVDGPPVVAAGDAPVQGGVLPAPVAPAPDAAGATAVLEPVAPQPAASPAGLSSPSAPAEAAPTIPAADPVPEPRRPAAPAQAGEEKLADGPQLLPVPPVLPEPGVVPAPEPVAPAEPAARPQPGFPGTVDGVRTGRLPSITAAGDAPAEAQPAGALVRNARPFDNPDGKPPFAILLLDDAGAAVDAATVAASPLPLTLVVDPAQPGAAERAALWRAAGQEVALLASGLPRRGGAADMEVAMEALAAEFPDALAVTDLPEGGVQGDRVWAGAVVPALAARGYGLVTWDQGLNAADQVARREGLPAVTIFRDLDAKDEAAPVIRRYLDRAAFKAQQDGRAVVIGRLRSETVAALLEWALNGRAASLGLAPLSAVFPK